MKDEDLGGTLDILSQRYLGTTGRSYGSWDDSQNCYAGGIFTGCKTSENHEVWERIFKIQECLLTELRLGLTNFKTWSWPGSDNSKVCFEKDGVVYYDHERTKPRNNMALFHSSLTGRDRSLTDVLRDFGYVNTHDTIYPGRIDGLGEKEMRNQLFFNAFLSRKDALLNPTTRTILHAHCRESLGLTKDCDFKQCYQIDKSNDNGIFSSLENLRHSLASGIVAGCVWDTIFSSKEQKYWKIILDYCQKTDVSVLHKSKAYEVCFKQKKEKGNLIYNPEFFNTLDEFMPDVAHPQNPDGWIGECTAYVDDGKRMLLVKGEVINKNYGLPYGHLRFSLDAIGEGSITCCLIRNKTDLGKYGDIYNNLTIDSSQWAHYTMSIELENMSLTDERDRHEGRGDKIIGVTFKYNGKIGIRNLNLEKI